LHYLDTTPLRRPAQRKIEKVIAKFDFDGSVSIQVALSHAIKLIALSSQAFMLYRPYY
jgi:hypothetical protein